MKTLNEYIMMTKKTYPFRIKVAGEVAPEQEAKMKTLLDKFQVVEFKKTSRTPVQPNPLDFPRLNNTEVNIFDVVLDYPATPYELTNYLGNGLHINEQQILVRNPNDPQERNPEIVDGHNGPLLMDSEYKEAPNANFDDFYGDKYNASFVKALSDDLKAKRLERNEVRPDTAAGQTLNDVPQGTQSPIRQSDYDPRKK